MNINDLIETELSISVERVLDVFEDSLRNDFSPISKYVAKKAIHILTECFFKAKDKFFKPWVTEDGVDGISLRWVGKNNKEISLIVKENGCFLYCFNENKQILKEKIKDCPTELEDALEWVQI